MHPKRHPFRMEYWAGCDRDGMLTALKARLLSDSGPYASVGVEVLERAAGHASGPYRLPVIDVESIAVRTNNPVCGAFRGFGANQAQFAMEGVIDRLAAEVGISAWEMRFRNAVTPGVVWGPGQVMDDGSLGARACLEAVKPAYDQAVERRQGGRPRLRAQELRSGERFSRDRQGSRPVLRRWRGGGSPLLDRDGPGCPHRRAPGRRRGARRGPGAGASRGRHDARAGCRPDDRFSRDGDGSRSGLRRMPARAR